MHERAYEKGVVKIRVVTYAPKVVTSWEGIKDYLRARASTPIGSSIRRYFRAVDPLSDG